MSNPNELLQPGHVVNERAMVVGKFENGSPEWHAARRGHLGGSEAASACGLSPWESRFSLYYRKRDELDDVAVTDSMEWGTRLEPVVLEKYAESLEPHQVITTGHTFYSTVPGYEWVSANPDGIVWEQDPFGVWNPMRILEIKTSARGDGFGTEESGVVPIYYVVQCLWYAWCLGVESIQLAALISGADYRVYDIEFDQGDVDFILDRNSAFWSHLVNEIEPDPTSDTATYETVRQLNPEIDPDLAIEVPASLGEEYISIEKAYSEIADLRKGVHARVMKEAGKARLIRMNDEVIARRQMPGRGDRPYLRYLPPKLESMPKVVDYAKDKESV